MSEARNVKNSWQRICTEEFKRCLEIKSSKIRISQWSKIKNFLLIFNQRIIIADAIIQNNNLSGMDLQKIYFIRVDFGNSKLSKVNFSRSIFRNCKFNGNDARNTCFYKCDFAIDNEGFGTIKYDKNSNMSLEIEKIPHDVGNRMKKTISQHNDRIEILNNASSLKKLFLKFTNHGTDLKNIIILAIVLKIIFSVFYFAFSFKELNDNILYGLAISLISSFNASFGMDPSIEIKSLCFKITFIIQTISFWFITLFSAYIVIDALIDGDK